MPIVWLIEDNAAFRRAIERALRARADIQQPRAYERCELAIKALQAGERPNIILMDIGLPGMDGIEGMRQIKSLVPEVSIVLLTVFEDNERIFQAICAGACGYLLKSESMQNVMQAIDQVRGGGAPMNSRVARRVLEMFTQLPTAQADCGLDKSERAVLELIESGLAKKELTEWPQCGPHTVDYLMRSIYQKLHVHCAVGPVRLRE